MARPTDYLPEYNEQGYRLALLGLKDSEMAKFFQIAESTYYEWLNKFPEFSESIKNGKEDADAKVAESLYKKATGQIRVTEETETEKGLYVTTKQLPPDTTAAIFWLKNRRSNWKDTTKHEHTGEDGAPIGVVFRNMDERPDGK
jgi:transposase